MDFVVLIMKCNNLNGMPRYRTTQTFLITRQSLCSMIVILAMTKNKVFLMNKINKQRFVSMLGETLEKNNYKSYYVSADADLLIIQKAVESATTMKTVLVGNDTDLFVLLCYHASLGTCNLLFKPEPKKKCQEYLSLGYTSYRTATRGGSMLSYSSFHHWMWYNFWPSWPRWRQCSEEL